MRARRRSWRRWGRRVAAQNPYSPALTVNDSAITCYDVTQRVRLIEALGARGDVRALAIEQLTEDRVKVQAARALGIELPEGSIATGLEEFATQRGLTVDDVFAVLAQVATSTARRWTTSSRPG